MIKKISKITLGIFLTASMLVIPTIKPKAKTLNDFQKELDQKQAEYDANKEKQDNLNYNKNLSEAEIKNSQAEIDKAEQELVETGEKIQELDRDIAEKNKQLKEIMRAVQQTDGNMNYLEYAFGAADMTDFIHRVSMAEELTAYNKKLITEMNNMVEESKALQVELKNKQVELNKKIEELNKKIASYNVQIDDIADMQVDVSNEIASLKKTITYYKNQGCSPNQDINTCLGNSLPYDTAFWRPVTHGYVSSEYGGRWHPTQGTYKFHYGTDIGVGHQVTNVYASAAGKVAVIENTNSNSCGGNYVIIHHNIKGTDYSSAYFHMEKIYVSIGQQVTKDTVLGLAGGNRYSAPGYTPWDKCSTGQHVHLTLARGLQLTVDSLYANSFNSRTMVNFPPVGSGRYFNDRTTKY